MILRMHHTEITRGQQHPLPWWDNDVRWALGLVALGSGGLESDPETGDDTGWVLFSDPSIGPWELWLLEVVRAGWAYIDSLPEPDREPTMALRAAVDWAAWDALKVRLDAEEITQAEAIEESRAYAVTVAAGLGMGPPDLEPEEG